ncbi:MAG: hypothetical protein AAB037_02050 [Chloroflexota bacterium]
MTDNRLDKLPARTTAEIALDLGSLLASAIPSWLGGPISNALGGVSAGRKFNRVREVIEGLAEDLRDFKSEVSENYVKTEDFEELWEKVLRQAANERSEEKRRILKDFLVGAIKSPGEEPYEEQIRVLRSLEEIQPADIVVLRAIIQQPNPDPDLYVGSHKHVLAQRLPGTPMEHIMERIEQLQRLGIINPPGIGAAMTGSGAEQMAHWVTPYGQRLIRFIGDG